MQSSFSRSEIKVQRPGVPSDARQFRRIEMNLEGRFMRPDRSEHACLIKALSIGDATVFTSAKVEAGERVVVYIDHLGGLEGIIRRLESNGFAFHYAVSEHKREKLAAQIMWLLNRDAFPGQIGRLHERLRTVGRHATLKVEADVVIDVELLDLSASGASCGTHARPQVGSFVILNKTKAIVRRHHETGVGIQFLTVMTPEALRLAFP